MWLLDYIEKGTYMAFRKQLTHILECCRGKTVAVWGAGVRGIVAGLVLDELGVEDYCYIDSAPEKQGKQLGGHPVVPFDAVDKTNMCFVLSMEYQCGVKELLVGNGLKEETDFFGLVSAEEDWMLDKFKRNTGSTCLVLGASVLNSIPLDEKDKMNLAESIEARLHESKVLGVPNLSMMLMYYLMETELFQNPSCKKVCILVDFKELTTYHCRLPRTQKPGLLRKLRTAADATGNTELKKQLETVYEKSLIKSEDYELENKYSPNRIEGERFDRIKQYLEYSVKDAFDSDCDEIEYLSLILKSARDKEVSVTIVIQPMNAELCRELCGEAFEKSYDKKRNILCSLAKEYGAKCLDAGELLSRDHFIMVNSPNDVLRYEGRECFAKYICDFAVEEE